MPNVKLEYKIMLRSDDQAVPVYDVFHMTGPDHKTFITRFYTWQEAAEYVRSIGGYVAMTS